ncbi:hypothetical protein K4A83_16650, partial [Spirulina subsalsa FACHB-351]
TFDTVLACIKIITHKQEIDNPFHKKPPSASLKDGACAQIFGQIRCSLCFPLWITKPKWERYTLLTKGSRVQNNAGA